MAGTTLCKPVAGTVEREKSYTGHAERNPRTETTLVTKGADDEYWMARIVVTGDEPTQTEFLARDIGSDFTCKFAEF